MNYIKTLFVFLNLGWIGATSADVNHYFNRINTNPKALYTFFKAMPKGGELHYHLAGGPAPEVMLSLVANSNYCLQTNLYLVGEENTHCNGVTTNTIAKNSFLYKKIIQNWSMNDFVPGNESAHDHFFNTFTKFIFIVVNYRPQLIANIIERAAAQNEQYLEIMDISDNAHASSFGTLIKKATSFAQRKKILLNNELFQKNIATTIDESNKMKIQARELLGCKQHPQSKTCQVQFNFIYYVLREQEEDSFFAQALNAFEAVSRSKNSLVGVNLVQAEDGPISLRDYEQQMRIFNYLHAQYPQVHIALHAGELTKDLVNKKDLTYHIHDAVFIGKAQRIGHGVDIALEDNSKATLAYMSKNQIPVEINLASNFIILNVSIKEHPLNYYLKHQVPIVLSTDDEGILRTNLTKQYVKATIDFHLDYQTIKQINRNTLTYAFIPGKSIWANARAAEPIAVCKKLNAASCISFIKQNPKAKLQWNLEKKLLAFENRFNGR